MAEGDTRSFEDLKTRLDEIVTLVSDDSLPLDEALDLYEEAVGIGLSASRIMEEGIAESNLASSDSKVNPGSDEKLSQINSSDEGLPEREKPIER